MRASGVKRTLATQKRFAVVTHENNERVFLQSSAVQYLQDFSESTIQISHIGKVARVV